MKALLLFTTALANSPIVVLLSMVSEPSAMFVTELPAWPLISMVGSEPSDTMQGAATQALAAISAFVRRTSAEATFSLINML